MSGSADADDLAGVPPHIASLVQQFRAGRVPLQQSLVLHDAVAAWLPDLRSGERYALIANLTGRSKNGLAVNVSNARRQNRIVNTEIDPTQIPELGDIEAAMSLDGIASAGFTPTYALGGIEDRESSALLQLPFRETGVPPLLSLPLERELQKRSFAARVHAMYRHGFCFVDMAGLTPFRPMHFAQHIHSVESTQSARSAVHFRNALQRSPKITLVAASRFYAYDDGVTRAGPENYRELSPFCDAHAETLRPVLAQGIRILYANPEWKDPYIIRPNYPLGLGTNTLYERLLR